MSALRRALTPLHRWIGLLAGVYFLLIALSGGALLFRIDMQRALDPALFTPVTEGPLADPVQVINSLRQAYPDGEVTGFEAPTNRRPTTLAYVQQDRQFITVLLDPASGRVLGELPQRALIRTLHALHFNLTLGRTGRVINGIGALLLTAMGISGAILWWRGRRRWREGFRVRGGQPPATMNHELHHAAGIWAVLALLMWGITGAAFTFPNPAMRAIGWFSPVESAEPPDILPPPSGTEALPLSQQIGAATALRPKLHLARVVLPGHPRVPLQLLFARSQPTVLGEPLEALFVDPWRGTVSGAATARSGGHALWDAFTLLHTAGFGGQALRALWLIFALSPLLLLATGVASWWLRRRRAS